MPFDAKAMGRVIRRLRKKQKITQEVFSGFAAISRSHLASLERGHTAKVETYDKVATAFDMPLSELFHLMEDEMNRPVK